MKEWLPVLISGAALIVAAFFPFLSTLRGLRANAPVAEATADEKQAAANASSFTAQQGVINTLVAQLDRRDVQISSLEQRISVLEQKVDETTAKVEERDKRNDLMTQQLRVSQEDLRVSKNSGQLLHDWVLDHFAESHPGEEPNLPSI